MIGRGIADFKLTCTHAPSSAEKKQRQQQQQQQRETSAPQKGNSGNFSLPNPIAYHTLEQHEQTITLTDLDSSDLML